MEKNEDMVGAGGPAKEETPRDGKPVELSDRRIAWVRNPNGRDLEKGAAAAGAGSMGNPIAMIIGVAGQVTTVDGTRIQYEDLLEWPMSDVLEVIGELMGNAPRLSRRFGINS